MNWFKLFLVIFSLTVTSLVAAPGAVALDPENTLYMDLKDGRVVIRMHPELAPAHCLRIKELVRQGFYDGLTFHRVIDGFMAQGGDPKGDGTGGSGQNIVQEFETFGSGISHTRGIASMARAQDPDSADSQFFLMLADVPQLDNQYTIWGEVVEGMEGSEIDSRLICWILLDRLNLMI